jgi:hypothetical protein
VREAGDRLIDCQLDHDSTRIHKQLTVWTKLIWAITFLTLFLFIRHFHPKAPTAVTKTPMTVNTSVARLTASLSTPLAEVVGCAEDRIVYDGGITAQCARRARRMIAILSATPTCCVSYGLASISTG